MITINAKEFESDVFAMHIIARGGFMDSCTGDGKTYYVDTINLRANHIMQNEYSDTVLLNARGCYETEEEWQAHQREHETLLKKWEEKVKNDLATLIPNINDGGCLIKKVHAEIFTVVHIYEITD